MVQVHVLDGGNSAPTNPLHVRLGGEADATKERAPVQDGTRTVKPTFKRGRWIVSKAAHHVVNMDVSDEVRMEMEPEGCIWDEECMIDSDDEMMEREMYAGRYM